MNLIGYVRVSTDEQARSGLGMEAQRTRIAAEMERRGWSVDWLTDDGYSAKDLNRPAITEALHRLDAGEADGIVVAKLDRLSRSLLDFAGLMEQARRGGWAVVALDLGVDTTTPSGEMMASVMAAFAQYERRLISQRVTEAMAEMKRKGVRLGRPVEMDASVRQRIGDLAARGVSQRQIARMLNDEQVPTARGARWHGGTVHGVLRSLALDREAEVLGRA